MKPWGWVVLALVPGLMLAHGCGGVELPPQGVPACPPDSTAEEACDCYLIVGIPPRYPIRECPAPTPEPTPEPTPAPTPEPTPEPTPAPTPEPTPEPTPPPDPPTCPPKQTFVCREGDNHSTQEGALSRAVTGVILSRPPYLVEVEERSDGVKAKIRTPDPDQEPDMWLFTEAVAQTLRDNGVCAFAGDPSGRSPDEVGVISPDGMSAEMWDVAKCGSHVADKRYCVGTVPGLLTQPFDCVRAFRPEPEPDELVLCEGTGKPPDWSWPEKRQANIDATNHWLPLAAPNATSPSQPTRPVEDGLLWLPPRRPAPWYATNPNLASPNARVRHEDGLEYLPARGAFRFVSYWRYYGSPDGEGCPDVGRLFDAEPSVAKVRP